MNQNKEEWTPLIELNQNVNLSEVKKEVADTFPLIELNQNVNLLKPFLLNSIIKPLIELNQNVNTSNWVTLRLKLTTFNRTKLECK